MHEQRPNRAYIDSKYLEKKRREGEREREREVQFGEECVCVCVCERVVVRKIKGSSSTWTQWRVGNRLHRYTSYMERKFPDKGQEAPCREKPWREIALLGLCLETFFLRFILSCPGQPPPLIRHTVGDGQIGSLASSGASSSGVISDARRSVSLCRFQWTIPQWHHAACQNTLPGNLRIKLYVNIQEYWSGGLPNKLWGVMRKVGV